MALLTASCGDAGIVTSTRRRLAPSEAACWASCPDATRLPTRLTDDGSERLATTVGKPAKTLPSDYCTVQSLHSHVSGFRFFQTSVLWCIACELCAVAMPVRHSHAGDEGIHLAERVSRHQPRLRPQCLCGPQSAGCPALAALLSAAPLPHTALRPLSMSANSVVHSTRRCHQK